MGQARLRGSRDVRIREAKKQRLEGMPEKIVCNNCQADILEIEVIDTSSSKWPGIIGVYAGHCPDCGQVTMAVNGTPEAQQEFAQAAQQELGDSAKFSPQSLRLKT